METALGGGHHALDGREMRDQGIRRESSRAGVCAADRESTE